MFRITLLSGFIIMMICFSGCQQEVTEIIDPPAEEVILPGSAVADLILRTSLKDGSDDNIIDHASCLTLVLPVTVEIDDNEIRIEDEDDLEFIRELLNDDDDDDDDELRIKYPVTVILPDYTELEILNEQELEELRGNCREDDDYDDIECLDFIYPFTLYVYDADNQLSKVVTVENDRQLYEFFEDFSPGEFYGIGFPASVKLADGGEIIINNNDELEDLLEEAIDACDEDDDPEYTNADLQKFENILTTGEWKVGSLIEDGEELTGMFGGYRFEFLPDGRIHVIAGSDVYTGTWELENNDGMLELDMGFNDDTIFEAIDDDWYIIDFGENFIRLAGDDDDPDDQEDLLILERD